MKLDARHTIRQEWTGAPTPQWVHRFCDEWINSYATEDAANQGAIAWEKNRLQKHLQNIS